MKYVKLGKTGLECAVISFGGIPVQRSDAANALDVVNALEKHGMNFIDTARGYTVSEEFLGAALVGRREKFVLATKSMARSYDAMSKDIETSLNNLRTDYIDLYQIHNLSVEEFDTIFAADGAYQALIDAQNTGKIGHIGVTAHSIETLQKILDEYPERFETFMFPFNIVELQGSDILKAARAKGIGTICMKPLAGGNLDDYRLALRFIASSDAIDISVVGMGSVDEVERNASVAEELTPLTENDLAQCEQIRKELGSRFCRRCGYCAPCTVGINISTCFLMNNYLHKYDLAEWAKGRYESMAHYAGDCVGCGVCEARCPYNLPIREMLREVAQVFGK